jgi:hypothetical protein
MKSMELRTHPTPLEQQAPTLHTAMHQCRQNVIGLVRPSSKRVYTINTLAFSTWLLDHHFTLQTIDRSGMIAFHDFLASTYKPATATRMWSVARNLLQESIALQLRADDPTFKLKGFKVDGERRSYTTTPPVVVCSVVQSR